jgi:hypothetical protein
MQVLINKAVRTFSQKQRPGKMQSLARMAVINLLFTSELD